MSSALEAVDASECRLLDCQHAHTYMFTLAAQARLSSALEAVDASECRLLDCQQRAAHAAQAAEAEHKRLSALHLSHITVSGVCARFTCRV